MKIATLYTLLFIALAFGAMNHPIIAFLLLIVVIMIGNSIPPRE